MVVLVVMAITLAISTKIVTERIRSTKIRIAASQLAVDLRSARLDAVANRRSVDVFVWPDPVNVYNYTDSRGRERWMELPPGVRIASSDSLVTFRANGSVLGGATAVLETNLSPHIVERWTVDTNALGISRTTVSRIGPETR
jgi:Tfp pilus assembly protein FimT